MPQARLPRPLRWYENLALFLLAQSPRIDRILVEQRAPADWSPEDDDAEDEDDEQLDDPHPTSMASFLEYLYRGPSAEKEGP